MAPIQQPKEVAMRALEKNTQPERVSNLTRWGMSISKNPVYLASTSVTLFSMLFSVSLMMVLKSPALLLVMVLCLALGAATLWIDLRSPFHKRNHPSNDSLNNHAKMRELGLTGQPGSSYFWEGRLVDRQGSKLLLDVRQFVPLPGQYWVRRYKTVSARGETVRELAEGPDGPEVRTIKVFTPYLEVEGLSESDLDAGLTREDQQTLARVEAWVTQLNQRELTGEDLRLRAAPPALPLGERKLAQVHEIRRFVRQG